MFKKINSVFILSFLPLLVYAIIDSFFGEKMGLIAAISCGLIECIIEYKLNKKLDGLVIFNTLLVVGMGGLSLALENPVFFKLKPAAIEFVFVFLFFSVIVTKTPFLILMTEKQFKMKVPTNSFQYVYMKGLHYRMGLFFLIHALLTIYAALYLSTSAWIMVKGILFYIALFLFLGIEMVYSKKKALSFLQRHSPKSASKKPFQFVNKI